MKNAVTSEARLANAKSSKTRTHSSGKQISLQPLVNGKPSLHGRQPFTRLNKLVQTFIGMENGPRIAFVYEDEEAHGWAREICEQVTKLSGNTPKASWWKISDLTAPGILAGAVSSALRADLIVVASKAEGLPLPFYVWVNMWWPNKSESPGALLALTTGAESHDSGDDRIGEYLRVVADQARMNFLRLERKSKSPHTKLPLNGNGTATNGLPGWNGRLHD